MNKYLEKIARIRKMDIVIPTAAGLAGGALHYKKTPQIKYENGKFTEIPDPRSHKRRIVEGVVGGAGIAGAAGLFMHAKRNADKDIPKALRKARDTYRSFGFDTAAESMQQSIRKRRMGKKYTYKHIHKSTGNYKGYTSNRPFSQYRPSHKEHLKTFGIDEKKYKTKAEYNKHFKTELHKNHPDKHGGSAQATKKFQDLSTARDNIHKSEWFEKLAMLNNRFINILL